MYQLPHDFDLDGFVGDETNLINIGLYQMDIDFIPAEVGNYDYGFISISGSWALARNGLFVDASVEHTREANEQRDVYRIHRLLGRKITGWAPEPPWGFRLDFEDGYSLRVWDETEGGYEYVSIGLPGEKLTRWFL